MCGVQQITAITVIWRFFKIDFEFQTVNADFVPTENNVPTYAGCAPLTLVMQNGSTTSATTTYTWYFGDGTSGTGFQPTHTYTYPDTFEVMLIVNSNGCAGSDTAYSVIIVDVGPSTDFIIPPLACEGVPVTIYLYRRLCCYLYMEFCGRKQLLQGEQERVPHTLSWANAGTYCPSVNITDAFGCKSDTATHCIDIIDVPTSDFLLPDTVCISNAATVTYIGNANAGAYYSWDFTGGNASPGGTVQGPHNIYWTTTGNHDVSLTVSANGCTGTPTTQTVYLEPGPIAAFNMTDSICENQTAVVSIIGAP